MTKITQTELKHIPESHQGLDACSGAIIWVHTTAVSIFHRVQRVMTIAGLRLKPWQNQRTMVLMKLGKASYGNFMMPLKAAHQDHLRQSNRPSQPLNHKHLQLIAQASLTQKKSLCASLNRLRSSSSRFS